MTPNEFSELTGKNMNADNFMDEYAFADRVYMAADELDKRSFCKDYKKHGLTATVCALTDKVDKLTRFNTTLDRRNDEAKAKMEKSGMALIDLCEQIADVEISNALYKQANILMGRKQAIIYRIHYGYYISEEDREYVIDILTNND